MARQNSLSTRQTTHFPAFDSNGTDGSNQEPSNALPPLHALVKRLSDAHGAAGSEQEVRELVRAEVKAHVDQVRTDALGNLIAYRRGSGAARKKVMLSSHLDEAGLIVTFVDADGFARISLLGKLKPSILPGARCRFANGAQGVIGRQDKGGAREQVEVENLFVDVVAAPEGARVAAGDTAVLESEFLDGGSYLVGKALEGRIGCAILIELLKNLTKSPHDLYCVFTAQETVGARGAGTAAYALQPDLAVVVQGMEAHDVPGARHGGIALGKGPAIHFKDQTLISSPSVRQQLVSAARDAHVPYQLHVSPREGGDGATIQAAREGIPTGALGVPVRYLRTTSEMVAVSDVTDAIAILTNLVRKPIG